jgi:hypothetical protein
MRIEKDEGARLIDIYILGQPIKRPSVIVLDINGQNLCCRTGGNEQCRNA